MTRPPLSAGAVQARLFVLVPSGVAVRMVGAPGATGARPVPLMTTGAPFMPVVKDAASLPEASWKALASSPAVGSV